ncbi:hypothetical protein TNCV_1013241 [Trichonephila clavipes]|uniref:Uncharacterized protein n=1 Tax=Trichonephila clavipes TaxID=2585209 RepID=A0A8X6VXG6_TRICX|nr:hypothetical protein TNCV_1013241 [Trichonephila clavipes]
MTCTPEPNLVEAWDVGCCHNSQTRAVAGRANQEHLFSTYVGERNLLRCDVVEVAVKAGLLLRKAALGRHWDARGWEP